MSEAAEKYGKEAEKRPVTAVEWLEDKFQKFLSYYEGHHKAEPYTIQELSNDFEHAREMEKQQIIEAWDNGFANGHDLGKYNDDCSPEDAEQYYNETYGKP